MCRRKKLEDGQRTRRTWEEGWEGDGGKRFEIVNSVKIVRSIESVWMVWITKNISKGKKEIKEIEERGWRLEAEDEMSNEKGERLRLRLRLEVIRLKVRG